MRSCVPLTLSLWTLVSLSGSTEGALRKEVKAKSGSDVSLPCTLNRADCGDFHSIKWYKENRRVFVYSPMPEFAKAEGELFDRAELMFESNSTQAQLQVSGVKPTDEGEYKCEITFLDITKNCPVVQLVQLTTLAEPKYLNVSLPDGRDLSSSVIGPFNEGYELRLICESGGGKPIPRVTWYNGTNLISGKSSSFEEGDKTGKGRNEVRIKLSRGDLGSQFTCRAENEATSQPLTTSIQIDISLTPFATEVIGAESPITVGSPVNLKCRTWGARPAAIITWFNGTLPFTEQPAGQVALQDDNTYETESSVHFVASRFENGKTITCESNNQVLDHYKDEPQKASVLLQIQYPPVVNVSSQNLTINETGEVVIDCTHDANPMVLTSVRWYHNGQPLDVSNRTRYDGATIHEPSLVIKSVDKTDIGHYSCILENVIGASASSGALYLNVFYIPVVTLRMDPPSPISELDRRNVTLFCDVESGNPEVLTSVKWYMDGVLLKQLPLCSDLQNQDMCDIDPSKLLLEHVSKSFHGNFSCEGQNGAGWSDISDKTQLEIFYPPGPAYISTDTNVVIKGSSTTLTCSVEEAGRPSASIFVWHQGGHIVNHVSTSNWTIDPVTLETLSNISCVASNAVGHGQPDFISIQVYAPPAFILRLPPYTGAMAGSPNFSIECQVECSPLCEIAWLKDGAYISDDDSRYTISFEKNDPNYAKNDFESVTSTLRFNIDRWRGGKLDRIIDNANYTCQSSGNVVGQGVASTTYFRVEYPPENIEISNDIIRVEEGFAPDKVLCTAEAYPEANYFWKHKSKVVATDNVLFFDHGITRNQAGEYECIAQNRHNSTFITTQIDVLFKPECLVNQREDRGQILLSCQALANPQDVIFGWSRENETMNDSEFTVNSDDLSSILALDPIEDNFGTYYCFVNNSIGPGVPCKINVKGVGLLRTMGNANIVVIVAVIAACIVALLVVIVIIILLCRHRRSNEKYTAEGDIEERENSQSESVTGGGHDEANATNSGGSDKPVHKWPIRPGVHVHVNGLHMLNNNPVNNNNTTTTTTTTSVEGQHPEIMGFSYGARNSGCSDSDTASYYSDDKGMEDNLKSTKARGTSTSDDKSKEQNNNSKSHNNPLSFGTSSTADQRGLLRTRQNQYGLNHNKNNSPDSGYPDGDHLNGKGFYENLPCHTMHQPSNKQMFDTEPMLAFHAVPILVRNNSDNVAITMPVNGSSSSRPSSQLSQNGSSGYGSTRSQMGPFVGDINKPSPQSSSCSSSDKQPKLQLNRSVLWSSLKCGKNAVRETQTQCSKLRSSPQFASLKIPNRVKHLKRQNSLRKKSAADRCLDLVEAEVDSETEEEQPIPNNNNISTIPPPPPLFPLRHACSLDHAQALTVMDTTEVPNSSYQCDSNTSSSSGRGSFQGGQHQHASLLRHLSSLAGGQNAKYVPHSSIGQRLESGDCSVQQNNVSILSSHIPMQEHHHPHIANFNSSRHIRPKTCYSTTTMDSNTSRLLLQNAAEISAAADKQHGNRTGIRGIRNCQVVYAKLAFNDSAAAAQQQQSLNKNVIRQQQHRMPLTQLMESDANYAVVKFNENNVGKEIDV